MRVIQTSWRRRAIATQRVKDNPPYHFGFIQVAIRDRCTDIRPLIQTAQTTHCPAWRHRFDR